jgi:hypothetical protein
MSETTQRHRLKLEILPQPDLTTCGPTCLQAVYGYFGDVRPLKRVIAEIPQFTDGGTLAVILGLNALKRGYQAKLLTYDLQVFDPTWFSDSRDVLVGKLREQMSVKKRPKLKAATQAYLEFLDLGGEIRMKDLTNELIRKFLNRSVPILTGLSATYLYQEERELPDSTPDDIRGHPTGHFVVLCGYDRSKREVLIADPLHPNPLAKRQLYSVSIDRVKCAILLGVMTYDANLLIIEPQPKPSRS